MAICRPWDRVYLYVLYLGRKMYINLYLVLVELIVCCSVCTDVLSIRTCLIT